MAAATARINLSRALELKDRFVPRLAPTDDEPFDG
jgi:hypothetical protein